MPLSQYAIEKDRQSGVPLIPIKEIYADIEFNCRGQFTSADIVNLAIDVAAKGLLEPIIIRELWDTEKIPKAQGFKYSLVAGFRRFAAYKTNDAEKIPAIVRQIVSEFDCRDINACENLQRKDLNLYQEAMAIKHYFMANWTQKDVAERVNMSQGWVKIRYDLLKMPPEVQQAAGQGYILQQDIVELAKYDTKKEILEMAGVIRDARKHDKGPNLTRKIKKKDKPTTKKVRSRLEIFELMEILRSNFKQRAEYHEMLAGQIVSAQGNCIATQCLAWAAGEIDSFTLHTYIKNYCVLLGLDYQMPEFSEESLLSL